jgi:hypothetical protein
MVAYAVPTAHAELVLVSEYAYSIIHKVTPFSKEHRGEANKITALALNAISKFEGRAAVKENL